MTDAPMTPREFAREIAGEAGISTDRMDLYEDGLYSLISARDAAIRREAQAEASLPLLKSLHAAWEMIDTLSTGGSEQCNLCAEGVPVKRYFDGRLMHFDGLMSWTPCALHGSSPDPNYIPRIVAQTRLHELKDVGNAFIESERCRDLKMFAHWFDIRVKKVQADLARLADADTVMVARLEAELATAKRIIESLTSTKALLDASAAIDAAGGSKHE